MPATVIVNFMTVVHQTSNGISMIFPDVCKTPAPPAPPIPIPYPNIAMSKDTAQGSKTVKMDGNPIMIKSSYYAMSTGDEPGAAMGVVSSKIKGKAYPKMYSMDVKVDGESVFRLLDIMLQNGSSPTNTPPGTNLQPPGVALPKSQKPTKAKIKEVKWDKEEACCGDKVKLSVKAEKMDGVSVVVDAMRLQPKKLKVGAIKAKIAGGKSHPEWIVRRGPFTPTVKLTASASGIGGPVKSGNQLEVLTSPEVQELIGPFQRLTPKFIKNATGAWVNSGTNYGWEVCYEAKIAKGELVITRKVDFLKTGGVFLVMPWAKKKWKKEIENVWDRRFKIHRTKCKRGKSCNCSKGCCLYPIRIQCKWGAGHGMQVTLHKGTNAPNGWGIAGQWWYSHHWWQGLASVPITVRAHEFGHLIGMYDEYPAGACDPARAFTNVPASIMNSGSTVFPRHMNEYKKWFDDMAGATIGKTKLLPM